MADKEAVLEAEEFEQDQTEAEERGAPEQRPDPETRERAKKYGWRDKDEYDRAPEGWVDADRYLELPSTQLKAARDTEKELRAELKRIQDEQTRIGGTVKAALEQANREAEARYKAELERVRQEQRDAVEAGDVTRWEALQKRADSLPRPQQAQPGPPADILAQHEWLKDPEVYQAAYMAIETNPVVQGLPPERQIAWARKQVEGIFPEKFETKPEPVEQPKPRNRVDGGGLASGAAPRREKGWDELPPAAKQAAQEFFDDGQFGFKQNPTAAKNKYAQLYWEQGA